MTTPNDIKADKAGEEYWTDFWKNAELPKAVQIDSGDMEDYVFRKLHAFYTAVFSGQTTEKMSLIEIGCGNSVYLSYFNKQFGLNVSGLDYSELGCLQTRKILERDGVVGDIHFGDLFNPPSQLLNKFDVVCSFGVVEHFEDTIAVIRHIGAFLKPGGILITSIPNLTGITGVLQKWMNKPVYDIHKVMGLKDIENYIREAGFKILRSERMIPVSFGVTLDVIDNKKVKFLPLKKIILKGFQIIGKAAWMVDDRIMKLPTSERFCAGMIVAARKPLDMNQQL